MNLKEYLAVIESYMSDSYSTVSQKKPELQLTKIGGAALTHVVPLSRVDSEKVLIRESAFHSLDDLESIFFKDGKVANDVYISPIASLNSELILQVDINGWTAISNMKDGVPFVRLHGLSVVQDSSGDIVGYESLPSCEIVPDDVKLIVDVLDNGESSKEDYYGKIQTSLMQILEGYEVTESFKLSLEDILERENDQDIVITLVQILGLVQVKSGSKFLANALGNSNREIRLEAFISGVKNYFSALKSALPEIYKDESDEQSRFIMLKNLVSSGEFSKEKINDMTKGLKLSKRELRFLEKKQLY